jgi:NitT/TauT family transport system ATP-binding protein
MGDFIRVERLVKRYRASDGSEVEALREVSFAVEQGEFVTLVGHSGCGKSTLLKILAGLVDRSAGTVTIDGTAVDGPRPDIGIVFQKPLLLEWRRVLENVLLPVEIYGLDRRRYEGKAHRLLGTAGLGAFLRKYPYELSGGMQQRVALCRALVAEPALLLMDEPFGSLDALTRQKMGFELLRLWQEWKSTVLFVTHDIVESIILADRVVVMSPRPGRIIDVVSVDLPRPRDLLMQDTPAFARLASRIRRRLWEEETADA